MNKKIIDVAVGTPELVNSSWGRDNQFISIRHKVSIYVDTNVDILIETLNDLKEEYGSEYSDLHIESYINCGCRSDCSCSPTHYLYGKRLETDLEYDFRIAKEAKEKQEREERERAQYEELRKKFDSDS